MVGSLSFAPRATLLGKRWDGVDLRGTVAMGCDDALDSVFDSDEERLSKKDDGVAGRRMRDTLRSRLSVLSGASSGDCCFELNLSLEKLPRSRECCRLNGCTFSKGSDCRNDGESEPCSLIGGVMAVPVAEFGSEKIEASRLPPVMEYILSGETLERLPAAINASGIEVVENLVSRGGPGVLARDLDGMFGGSESDRLGRKSSCGNEFSAGLRNFAHREGTLIILGRPTATTLIATAISILKIPSSSHSPSLPSNSSAVSNSSSASFCELSIGSSSSSRGDNASSEDWYAWSKSGLSFNAPLISSIVGVTLNRSGLSRKVDADISLAGLS